MRLRYLLKRNARRALQGNWGQSVAVVLLLFCVAMAFLTAERLLSQALQIPYFIDVNHTPGLLLDDVPNWRPKALALVTGVFLLQYILSAPFELGAAGWFFKLGEAQVDSLYSVFDFLRSPRLFFKAVGLRLCVALLRVFWCVLICLPAAAVLLFSWIWVRQGGYPEGEELIFGACFVTGCILLLTSLALAAIWTMRYALAPFVLLCDPQRLGVFQALSYSVMATRGRLTEYFLFELSFLGWRIGGLFILPLLYGIPYIRTAQGLFARFLIESYQDVRVP